MHAMTYGVEHLSKSFFATCMSSLVRCLLKFLVHFSNWAIFLVLSLKISVYSSTNSPLSLVSFLSVCGLSYSLHTGRAVLILVRSSLSILYILYYAFLPFHTIHGVHTVHGIMPLVFYVKSHCHTKVI